LSGLPGAAEQFDMSLASYYTQYYGNQFQSGFLALIFITCLAVVREKKKGTAILTLTKNISRPTFVLAKYISYVIWYTVVYVVSSAAFAAMIKVLINESINKHTIASFGLFYLIGIMFAAGAIFASCIGKNTIVSCLIGFGVYIAVFILAAIPYVNKFTPAMLLDNSITALSGNYENLLIPLLTCIGCTVLFLVLGIVSFEKQEL
jgi:ABC-2 type transport system permease protein